MIQMRWLFASEVKGVPPENETRIPVDDNIAIQDTWVNSASDYTSQDKKSSEAKRTDDSFSENNREKKKAFCSTCPDSSDTQEGAFNAKYGEDNWKKGAEKLCP